MDVVDAVRALVENAHGHVELLLELLVVRELGDILKYEHVWNQLANGERHVEDHEARA